MTPKETLEMLKNICRNCLENEPSDPTEREIGYSAAMEHIVQIIDKQTNKVEKQTPIQWLCMKLSSKLGMPNAIHFYVDHQVEILEALEMEKKQQEQIKEENEIHWKTTLVTIKNK